MRDSDLRTNVSIKQKADWRHQPLSVCGTVHIAGSIEKSLVKTIRTFQARPLALDESTDSTGTAQLAVFEVSMDGEGRTSISRSCQYCN